MLDPMILAPAFVATVSLEGAIFYGKMHQEKVDEMYDMIP
jgi:hypothetical protein